MKDTLEIYGQDYDERLIPIFADPNFLLPNLLGALNVEVKENEFKGEIQMSILFGRSTFLIYGNVIVSQNYVTYIINIPGYGPDKGGRIKISISKGKITIDIDLGIPIESLNSRQIKKKIKEFEKNANELIRIERIRRKI